MAFADPIQNIGQPSLWVHIVELGRLQQRVDGGGAFTAAVGTREKPVLPAHGDSAQGVLRKVVVDLKPPVFGIGEQLELR